MYFSSIASIALFCFSKFIYFIISYCISANFLSYSAYFSDNAFLNSFIWSSIWSIKPFFSFSNLSFCYCSFLADSSLYFSICYVNPLTCSANFRLLALSSYRFFLCPSLYCLIFLNSSFCSCTFLLCYSIIFLTY